MASLANVALWAGLVFDNRRHALARIRAFTGEDEAVLMDSTRQLLPAERTTWLLTRMLERIGDLHPVSESHIRQLTVGDRERLLFALCAATFSDEMDLVSRCPFGECGELSELTLPLKEWIPPNPSIPPADWYEKQIDAGNGKRVLRFRFPTGADQEAASRQLQSQRPEQVELALIRDCLLEVRDSDGAPVAFEAHLAELKPHLEAAWSELDPLGDCFAKVDCSGCDRLYTAVVDALTLFETRLENRGNIFEQVHRLARAYHWSERELLSLSFSRRHRYLSLVDAQGGAA